MLQTFLEHHCLQPEAALEKARATFGRMVDFFISGKDRPASRVQPGSSPPLSPCSWVRRCLAACLPRYLCAPEVCLARLAQPGGCFSWLGPEKTLQHRVLIDWL